DFAQEIDPGPVDGDDPDEVRLYEQDDQSARAVAAANRDFAALREPGATEGAKRTCRKRIKAYFANYATTDVKALEGAAAEAPGCFSVLVSGRTPHPSDTVRFRRCKWSGEPSDPGPPAKPGTSHFW